VNPTVLKLAKIAMNQTEMACSHLKHHLDHEHIDIIWASLLLTNMAEQVIIEIIKDVESVDNNLAKQLKIKWQSPPSITITLNDNL